MAEGDPRTRQCQVGTPEWLARALPRGAGSLGRLQSSQRAGGARGPGRSHCLPCPPALPRAVEDLSAKLKPYQQKDWRHAPRFLTPLKPHTVLRGQDCTMTCAFLGNPQPTVTLYKGDVNITANSKFWYNSTSGVCTIVIPTCTLKDSGEYSVLVENELGKDRSSCALTVYGEGTSQGGAGRCPCGPPGPEGRMAVSWCRFLFPLPSGGVNIHQLAVLGSSLPSSPCHLFCAWLCRLGGLQSLVGVDLPLKKKLVNRPKPDSPVTISVAGFWKEFLCLQDLTGDSDMQPRLKTTGQDKDRWKYKWGKD